MRNSWYEWNAPHSLGPTLRNRSNENVAFACRVSQRAEAGGVKRRCTSTLNPETCGCPLSGGLSPTSPLRSRTATANVQHTRPTDREAGCQWYQAFFAQALHQPVAITCLPANNGQPPVVSLALPWNNWQVAQLCAEA